jgi:Tol biopolymer transport system component
MRAFASRNILGTAAGILPVILLSSCTRSPDGVGAGNACSVTDKIVFTTNRSGSFNVAIMDGNGGNLKLLTNDDLSTVNQHPAFTRDCSQIVWDRNGRISIMNVDGTNQRELPTPSGVEHVGHPWVGADSRIYFVGEINQAHRIFRMGMDGTNIKQLTGADADRVHPSLRNDGNILVFTSSSPGARTGQAIRLLDQSTNTEKALYEPGWPVSAATWNPDGQSVVVAEDEGRTGTFSIVQVSYPDGRRMRQLVSGGDNTIPYYDYPAGQWINWVRQSGPQQDRDIWRARADGSAPNALTGGPWEDTKIVGWAIVETAPPPGSKSGVAPRRVCVPRPATCSPNPPPCPPDPVLNPGLGPSPLEPTNQPNTPHH